MKSRLVKFNVLRNTGKIERLEFYSNKPYEVLTAHLIHTIEGRGLGTLCEIKRFLTKQK